jgi:hypothetical protein
LLTFQFYIFFSADGRLAPNMFTEADIRKLFVGVSIKSNKAGYELAAELVNLFVRETLKRARQEMEREGAECIEMRHLERVIPQLLLDFQ